MPHLIRDQYSIYYEIHGEGLPVLLLHGICVSFAGNYGGYGWIDSLCQSGMQVIGMDFRGHGRSDKPHDPASYGTRNLAGDVVALMDHLNLETASVVGYSLGSVIALHLLHTCPQRFGRSVLIATGDGLLGHPPHSLAELAAQLLQALDSPEYPAELPKHVAAYWNFATLVGGDRAASAAAARAAYPPCSSEDAGRISSEVLVVSGELDPVLGRGPLLARALPHGRYLEIPGADHFMLAVSEEAKNAVARFLANRETADPSCNNASA